MLVSKHEISHYRDNGYVITTLILPEALLKRAERRMRSVREGHFDHPLDDCFSIFDRAPSETEPIEQYGYLSLRLNEFAAILRHPFIAQAAGELAGADRIRLFHDRLIVKHPVGELDPQDAVIGWHTDKAYWATATSKRMLTAWMPFQDCDVSMGSLVVLPGSHRWQGNDWMATAHETDMACLEASIQHSGNELRTQAYRMVRGQVAFHHCMTLHGSKPNFLRSPRTSWAVHLQDETNRYVVAYKPDGRRQGHLNDFLCRPDRMGNPDYEDDSVFPILWSTSPES